jgi:hypothetical protein
MLGVHTKLYEANAILVRVRKMYYLLFTYFIGLDANLLQIETFSCKDNRITDSRISLYRVMSYLPHIPEGPSGRVVLHHLNSGFVGFPLEVWMYVRIFLYCSVLGR